MDETITLNNGVIINGYVLESDGVIYMYLYEISMQNAFNLLIFPQNTVRMVANRNGEVTTIEGYNHLFFVREEYGGMISAGMKKV